MSLRSRSGFNKSSKSVAAGVGGVDELRARARFGRQERHKSGSTSRIPTTTAAAVATRSRSSASGRPPASSAPPPGASVGVVSCATASLDRRYANSTEMLSRRSGDDADPTASRRHRRISGSSPAGAGRRGGAGVGHRSLRLVPAAASSASKADRRRASLEVGATVGGAAAVGGGASVASLRRRCHRCRDRGAFLFLFFLFFPM